MTRICLDTNIFIYHFEDDGHLGNQATRILERISERNDELMTASLTIGEVLVKPVELGDSYLEMRYRTLLREPIVTIVPFDAAAGVIFAHIRQDRRIKRADAIHLASAASAGCDLFITNDERLSQVVVPGIQFITSMDRAPL